jgi:hypothetical protein
MITAMFVKENMKLLSTLEMMAINCSLIPAEELAIDNVSEKTKLASLYRKLLPVCY